MAATHKNKRNKPGSKRKFRKVTKKGTQNKRKRRTIKKQGGTTNSAEKDALLMKMMPHKPLNSLRRAFSKTDMETFKNMTPEEREATYNNWRNIEAETRKRLRLMKRENIGENEPVKRQKISDMDETPDTDEMPEVYYENGDKPFDPYSPDDPKNDLQETANWDMEQMPKKRAREPAAVKPKPIMNMWTPPTVNFVEEGEFDASRPYDPMNDLQETANWENEVPSQEEDIDLDEDLMIEGIDVEEDK